MIKGSLLLSTPFWAKIWRFWEINRGLKINLTFITSKRHILALFHVFCAMTRKNPSIGPTCARASEKGINKNNFCYISPICPEGTFVRNLCIWVHLYEIWYRGLLADVINCADFLRLVQGYWFCKGLKFAYSHRNWRSPLTLTELFRLWGKLNWAFQRTHYWIPTIQDSWDTPSWKSTCRHFFLPRVVWFG